MGDPRISCQWERVLLHKICLPAKVASFCENIHLQYIFTRLSQYYKHFVSQYLVSNVFWIRPMAIGLQIGYRCIATTPCLSARDPSGSTFANPLPPRHPVTPPSMFSIHFPLSSPWLLLFESHPNCSVWELDLFSLLSQPPLSMSCPQCTSSPHYWVFVRFPAPRTSVGGQVAKITTQLFGRDSVAITTGSAPVIPKHPPASGRGVDKLSFNRFEPLRR